MFSFMKPGKRTDPIARTNFGGSLGRSVQERLGKRVAFFIEQRIAVALTRTPSAYDFYTVVYRRVR